MNTKNIKELRNLLDNNSITKEELFEDAISKANKYQDKYNSFITIMDKIEYQESTSLLDKIPYALKDNISTKNIKTTASSNILKDYIPVYDNHFLCQ